ncbi:2'-5' RNA ligase family protein [Pseudonocardia humida]|uniref:2'-5' RNA ligase family protein n=1 Tax=Pseudonocardia humida TaxID=2800819 RepID=A0ABT0ZWU4_9PSEU|nr:2'-5' RNA ligase family protein [Pseudonocardia humida]MCO1655191.1 2'-5' RNA ligase family protein [Pseudonocardia humida]
MAQGVRFRLDDAAVAAIDALRDRVGGLGIAVPGDQPTVTVAAAGSVPAPARAALDAELRLLALPSIWLATLGTVAGRPDELVLAAVVDAELLAVHAAVHDALAGRVRGPVAAYLPGTWLPHCVLAVERPAEAFAALHPVTPVRARVTGVEIS